MGHEACNLYEVSDLAENYWIARTMVHGSRDYQSPDSIDCAGHSEKLSVQTTLRTMERIIGSVRNMDLTCYYSSIGANAAMATKHRCHSGQEQESTSKIGIDKL